MHNSRLKFNLVHTNSLEICTYFFENICGLRTSHSTCTCFLCTYTCVYNLETAFLFIFFFFISSLFLISYWGYIIYSFYMDSFSTCGIYSILIITNHDEPQSSLEGGSHLSNRNWNQTDEYNQAVARLDRIPGPLSLSSSQMLKTQLDRWGVAGFCGRPLPPGCILHCLITHYERPIALCKIVQFSFFWQVRPLSIDIYIIPLWRFSGCVFFFWSFDVTVFCLFADFKAIFVRNLIKCTEVGLGGSAGCSPPKLAKT